MKKFSSNQKGFAPIVIILIIAVLIVAGAVGYFVFARDDSEPASSTDGTSEGLDATDDRSFSGSYFEAMERGNPLQCHWRLPEETASGLQVGEGEFYTDGENRGYSKATFEIEGGTTTAYAVFDSEYIYSWFNIPGSGLTGVKMPRSQIEAGDSELSEAQQQQAIDISASYSFDCEPWEVDESILTPPSDVNFTEITT